MKNVLLVFWRVFWAFAFYPLVIGLMLWLYLSGHHWGWMALVLAATLYFDQTWLFLLRRLIGLRPKK